MTPALALLATISEAGVRPTSLPLSFTMQKAVRLIRRRARRVNFCACRSSWLRLSTLRSIVRCLPPECPHYRGVTVFQFASRTEPMSIYLSSIKILHIIVKTASNTSTRFQLAVSHRKDHAFSYSFIGMRGGGQMPAVLTAGENALFLQRML